MMFLALQSNRATLASYVSPSKMVSLIENDAIRSGCAAPRKIALIADQPKQGGMNVVEQGLYQKEAGMFEVSQTSI